MDLDKSINLAVKSGKTKIGMKLTLKLTKFKQAKAVIIAANALAKDREDLEYYANLSDIPIIRYPKSALDLGNICGRPHFTSALAIISPGDSDVLDFMKQENESSK